MPSAQPSLFADHRPEQGLPQGLPEGLSYRPELVTPSEERALAEHIAGLELRPFEFRGYLGNRRVAWFGWKYDYGEHAMKRAEDIPDWLGEVRIRAAALAGLEPRALEQALVTEYAPGAGIGWHRDRPQFGDVFGISLLEPCVFRLRLKEGAGWRRASFLAEPRSAYLLRDAARKAWEHSIAPMQRLRYSITFRTLREPEASPR